MATIFISEDDDSFSAAQVPKVGLDVHAAYYYKGFDYHANVGQVTLRVSAVSKM